jgi:ketosteroid isomerase-like protein
MELAELLARESIRDLVARYNSNGDTGRFAQVMELFADDAVMTLLDRSYHGRTEILTILTGVAQRGANATKPAFVRHMTATHQIDLVDADHATGRLYFQVLTQVGLDHWGRYMDRYRVVDGTWKFASRTVTVDGYGPNSTFAD